jgi:hypothetical protein
MHPRGQALLVCECSAAHRRDHHRPDRQHLLPPWERRSVNPILTIQSLDTINFTQPVHGHFASRHG